MPDLFRVYSKEECALGREGYPPEWDSVSGGSGIKHIVRARAGDRCERCLHPYVAGSSIQIAEANGGWELVKAGEWSTCDEFCRHTTGPTRRMAAIDVATMRVSQMVTQARWRILTVHHLDQDKANCRWWNLVALCQRDHLIVQRHVVLERSWPWPHSDWFRLYAAGWYAWRFLGEDLSREETEARMDDLLALGARESAVERMPL